MENKLTIYNTLSRKKELFEPINPPFVGLYVCGPTVYGDAHLGHARPAITFDLLFRYLKFMGYRVRYVRNITDVGHLVNDADEGEDKIAKKAKLEQLEPMEVVQFYSNRYHKNMEQLNTLPPSMLEQVYDRCIRIPMRLEARSLNLSNSVAIVLYEALRQTDFPGLSSQGHLTGRDEEPAPWLDYV